MQEILSLVTYFLMAPGQPFPLFFLITTPLFASGQVPLLLGQPFLGRAVIHRVVRTAPILGHFVGWGQL